jgi:two-component system cell cycle sensor histidine kinase/response regulator CckA
MIGLRARLLGAILVAILPPAALFFLHATPKILVGAALASWLAAFWVGDSFVLGKLRALALAARRVGQNSSHRSLMADQPGEIGEVAEVLDRMASGLEERAREREEGDTGALNRTLQQAAVAALGQLGMTSNDFSALLNQAVLLLTQTLEIEFCRILELQPERNTLVIRAGAGWKKGTVGSSGISAAPGTQAGFTLHSGEPVVMTDLADDTRFARDPILAEHGIRSGISVAIGAQQKTYGVLEAYSQRSRKFSSDDLQFLLAVANVLGAAVERRRDEEKLRKLAEFTELNPNPALELDSSARPTYYTPAVARLAEAMQCAGPADFLPDNVQAVVQECLATGQSRELETRFRERVLSWSFHPMISLQVVHAYATDITRRVQLEAQLRQGQKMELFSQLASGLAHDFNNMLTVIQGHASMITAREELPPELKESARSVVYAAQRAAGLTQHLLLFTSRSAIQARPIDLNRTLTNSLRLLKRLVGDGVIVDFSPAPQLPLVHADPALIERSLMSLAANASEAMPHGGRLEVRLRPLDLKAETLPAHPEGRAGRFVCLSISDTGCGMSESIRARMFEPFFTTKETGKAMGLGLAAVYGILRQHEGWIEVFSEPGKGSRFDLIFPAAAVEESDAKQPAQSAVAPRGTERVLLVEDDASVLNLGRIILEDCGYKVVTASGSEEALARWRESSGAVDLLLADMVMPNGMSGMALAGQLTAEKPGLRVVFTSGYTLADLDTDFLKRGAFLQKPYTRLTLALAVRESLDQPVRVAAGGQAAKA